MANLPKTLKHPAITILGGSGTLGSGLGRLSHSYWLPRFVARNPSKEAQELAIEVGKNPRYVQAVLNQSVKVIKKNREL